MRRQTDIREDVKAELRKKHDTLGNFEKKRGLASRSVTDVLRGKPSQRTADAIADELGCEVHDLFPDQRKTANADCSDKSANLHRENAKVRRA